MCSAASLVILTRLFILNTMPNPLCRKVGLVLVVGIILLVGSIGVSAHVGEHPSVHDTVHGIIERLRRQLTPVQLHYLSNQQIERYLTSAERQCSSWSGRVASTMGGMSSLHTSAMRTLGKLLLVILRGHFGFSCGRTQSIPTLGVPFCSFREHAKTDAETPNMVMYVNKTPCRTRL